MSYDSETKEFSSHGYIEKNLDALIEKRIDKKNTDVIILVVGEPGTGKSALTFFCINYLTQGDIDWDAFAINDEEHKKVVKSMDNKHHWYDEGRDSYYRRNANTTENKDAIDMQNQYRYKNHIQFINFQNLSDIEPDLLFRRAHAVFRCTKQGRLWAYGKNDINQINLKNKNDKVEWPKKPVFKESWPDPENHVPEEWKKYEEIKRERLDQDEEDVEEEKDENSKFDDEQFYKVTTVADKLDVSRDTIYRWIDDGVIPCNHLPNGKKMIPRSGLQETMRKKENKEEAAA